MIPNTKVFVGSLPPGAKPQELRRLFENFGVVTECDIMNRCGFVHMESAEVAEKAIQGLNNSYFMGQTISVEPGRMKERRAPMGGRGGDEGAPRGVRTPYSRGAGADAYSNGFQQGGPSSRIASNNIDLGGGAPIRRSNHSGPARNVPYARYGGPSNGGGGSGPGSSANGYERRNYYGGSPAHANDGYGSPNGGTSRYNSSGPSGGGSRYNNSGYSASGSGYSMGSQDRRGFALPNNRHTDDYAGANNLMYTEQASGSRSGDHPYGGAGGYLAEDVAYGGQQRRTPSYGNDEHYSQVSSGPYQYDQGGYSGQSHGGNSQGAPALDGYSRRPAAAESSGGNSASYGRTNYGSASGFNQEFPPLGSSSSMSRTYPSGPQASRRDGMPQNRY